MSARVLHYVIGWGVGEVGQQRSPAHAHVLDYVRGCGGLGGAG